MGILSFRTEADYQEVIRLREEIKKLKTEIRSTNDVTEIERLQGQLEETEKKFTKLSSEASRAGSAIEKGYKEAMVTSTQEVERLTEKLEEQKKKLESVKEALGDYRFEYNRNTAMGLDQSSPEQQELTDKMRQAQNEKAELEHEIFKTNKALAEHKAELAEVSEEYERASGAGKEMDTVFGKVKDTLSSGLGLLGIGTSVVALGNQVIQTRKQFQLMETSIQTLLGSKAKTDELLAKVKQYAAISPLELGSISSATQMMLGFNIEAEEVPKYIAAIGDVSMSEAGKFNSLTLAFSQMSATGKLMGQDLNQMINAGFNPLSEISRTTGRSVAELKEEMSKGAISAKMVQDAFISATSAGGKFHNMSQEASKTIGGQMSMLQDSIDAMFNSWGEASEGVIVKSISAITSLIENYKKVGAIIGALVATYGSYRASVIAVTVAESLQAKGLKGSVVAMKQKVMATKLATTATKLFNTALKANPLVFLASAIIGVTTGLIAFAKAEDQATKGHKAGAEALEKVNSAEEERLSKAKELLGAIQDKTKSIDEQTRAYGELAKIAPEITANLTQEQIAVMETAKAYEVLEEQKQKNIKTELQRKASDLQNMISGLQASGLKTPQQERGIKQFEKEYGDQFGVFSFDSDKIKFLNGELEETRKQLDEINKQEHNVELAKMSPEDRIKALEEEKKGYEEAKNTDKVAEIEKKIKKEQEAIKAKRSATEDLADAQKELTDAEKKYNDLKKSGKATTSELTDAQKNVDTAKKKVEEIETLLGIDKKKREQEKKDAETARKEQEKRDKEALSMLEANEKAKLDLMDDTHETRLKKIDANYKEELAKITKQEEQWKTEQKGKLTRTQEQALSGRREIAFEQRNADVAKENLSYYGDLTTAVDKYRNALDEAKKKKQELQTAYSYGLISEGQRNAGFQNADEKLNADTEELEVQIAEKSDGFSAFVDDLEKMTLDAIQRTLTQAEATLIAYENSNKSAQEVAVMRQKVKKLREELENRKSEKPDKKSFKEWARLDKVIRDISGSFNDLGDRIGGVEGEALKTAGTIMTSTMGIMNSIQTLTEKSAQGVETTATAGSKAIQAMEKASVILAIIGLAMQLIDSLTSMIKDDDEKWAEKNSKTQEVNRMKQAVNDYEMAVLKAKQAEKGWFSQSGISNLTNSYEQGQKALQNYYSKANEMQEKYQNEAGGGWLVKTGKKLTGAVANMTKNLVHVTTGGLLDKVAEATDFTILTDKAYRAVNDVETQSGKVKAIDNLRIETKEKQKGFLGIGAKSQKTESVQEWMDKNMNGMKLFDENNMIDIEAATLLLEKQGDKLVGNTKETIEQLIKYKEQYDEWIQSLRDHVSEMYSPLVDSMTESILTWLETGEDALKTFQESAGDTFRAIVQDMIKTMVLSNVVGTFQDDIAKLYESYMETDKGASATEALMENVNRETSALMQRYKEQIPALQSMTENINKTLLDNNIDIVGNQTSRQQDATYGGYETMSEQTGTELSGRFTAMYIVQSELLAFQNQAWEIARNNHERTLALSEVGNEIMANALLSLMAIQENTSMQPRALRMLMEKLEQWDEPIKNLA